MMFLDHEMQLPIVIAERCQVTIIGEVEHFPPRAGTGAGQQWQLVIAIQMHLIVAPASTMARQ